MKNIIKSLFAISFLLLFTAIVVPGEVNAQKGDYIFTTDTVSASSALYYPSSAGLKAARHSVGVITFTFTHTDLADSLASARLEYLDHASGTWTAMTGNAALTNTSTDGQSTIYASTPLLNKWYRAALACAATDSVKITNATLLYKEE